MEHFKRSTARDFRINGATLEAALRQESSDEEEENDDENDDQQDEVNNNVYIYFFFWFLFEIKDSFTAYFLGMPRWLAMCCRKVDSSKRCRS